MWEDVTLALCGVGLGAAIALTLAELVQVAINTRTTVLTSRHRTGN